MPLTRAGSEETPIAWWQWLFAPVRLPRSAKGPCKNLKNSCMAPLARALGLAPTLIGPTSSDTVGKAAVRVSGGLREIQPVDVTDARSERILSVGIITVTRGRVLLREP